MRKELLSLTALAFLAISAQAQSILQSVKTFDGKLERATKTSVLSQRSKALKKSARAPRKADALDPTTQRYVGPYTSDTYASSGEGIGLPSYPGQLGVASVWSADILQPFDGKVVNKMRLALANSTTVQKAYVLGVSQTSIDTVAVGDVNKELAAGWTTVNFKKSFTINSSAYEGYLVGFDYTQSSDNKTVAGYPLSMVNEGNLVNTYIYGDLGEGTGWYNLGTDYGNLSVQLLAEGTFNEKDMRVLDFELGSLYAKPGAALTLSAIVNNFGSKAAGYDYAVTVDGKAVTPTDVKQQSSLAVMANDTLQAKITLLSDLSLAEKHKVGFQITKIGGETPTVATDDDAASASFTAYSESVDRQKTLMEHFTSRTCTNCYLGEEIIDALDDYRTDVAKVSIHGNLIDTSKYPDYADPANNAQADSIFSILGAGGWPAASFDRSELADMEQFSSPVTYSIGYPEDYTDMVAQILSTDIDDANAKTPSFTTLTVTPKYNGSKVYVTVSGKGVKDAAKYLANEGVYVYLAEDSLKYTQVSAGKLVDATHNHAFRVALGKGILGNAITGWDGDNFTMTFTCDLDSAWKPQYMKAVAFVAPLFSKIQTYAELAVNQCEEAPLQYDATAAIRRIDATSDNNTAVVARYNLAGQRVNNSYKGVMIVKLANGKTVKVLK